MGILLSTALPTATISLGTFALQGLAHAAIPLSMKRTGTVIAGVGTIHMAGGISAILQSFAASTILGPIAGLTGMASFGIFCVRKILLGFERFSGVEEGSLAY